MIENLKLKKVNAPKDLPLLASLSMAVPILIGLLSNNLKLGMTASLAAILVVYFPLKGSFSEKILIFCKKYLKIINSINLDIIKNILIWINKKQYNKFNFSQH